MSEDEIVCVKELIRKMDIEPRLYKAVPKDRDYGLDILKFK